MPPRSAIFAAALGLMLLVPASAWACSRDIAPTASVVSEVPYDGVVHVRYACPAVPCDAAAIARTVVVRSPDGAQVPGTLVASGVDERAYGPEGWALFRPTVPFTIGAAYLLGFGEASPPDALTFSAVREAVFDPRTLDLSAQLRTSWKGTGTRTCCEPRREDPCDHGQACFWTERVLRPTLETVAPELPPGASQWLFRTTYRADGQVHAEVAQPAISERHEFDVAASRYCSSVVAEHITTGERIPIAEHCFDAAVTELTREADSALLDEALEVCASAPAGFEQPFAAARAEANGCDLGRTRSGLHGFFNALLVLGLAALGMRLKV